MGVLRVFLGPRRLEPLRRYEFEVYWQCCRSTTLSEGGSVQQFVEGVDPREYVRRHCERGPIKYTYTRRDVERALRVSPRTLYRCENAGLDISDIEDICRAWHERVGSKEAP